MRAVAVIPNVTCLGCGCACDDIEAVVEDGRIVEPRHACELGTAWFAAGRAPARACVDGSDASVDTALDRAATLLKGAARPLVYLAPELSCEAQREAVALADRLRAALDSVTSATSMRSMLAQQERGRAGATLGEIRNRADVLVFWGTDPRSRYPRYPTRYAPEPAGVHLPLGRRSRTVVAVDLGEARGPADADLRVAVRPEEEVAILTALRAALDAGGDLAAGDVMRSAAGGADAAGLEQSVGQLLPALRAGKYVVIVADAEPDEHGTRDAGRAEALIALTQALNGPTRAALSPLRGGGNRSGADAVLTWQTGYPAAVSFARGYPEYRPHEIHADLRAGRFDAVLVAGALASVPAGIVDALTGVPAAVVGPDACGASARVRAAIDTATAGIHEGGTAIRMDDVPLPLRPPLSGPPAAADILAALRARLEASPRL